MPIPKLYEHQDVTAAFVARTPRCFITSDPGTGKTRAVLEGLLRKKGGGRILVLAPLSILQPAWGDDIEKFFPGLNYVIAHGTPKKRKEAFALGSKIVITNHDAVKWITQDLDELLEGFTSVIVDEFTAYKNRTSQRSKALGQLVRKCENRVLMSGTPNSNHVTDIWYPAFLLDSGKRLGAKFWNFRSQVCEPQQIGPNPQHVQWDARPGAEDMIADQLKDITIRYAFDDCVDVPENVEHTLQLNAPPWLMKAYEKMEQHSSLVGEGMQVNAVNAGVRVKKLLQILSGAVYGDNATVSQIHTERYQLVIELIQERESCLVAYNWKHELTQLLDLADKAKITYGCINGSTPLSKRIKVVSDFQEGKIQVIFAHPQSAGHGLTLTKGTTTIWCSPTYNAEHFQQFNRRIYRAGQTRKTETIRIAYRHTKEVEVYEKLDEKLTRMGDLLQLFDTLSPKGKLP